MILNPVMQDIEHPVNERNVKMKRSFIKLFIKKKHLHQTNSHVHAIEI